MKYGTAEPVYCYCQQGSYGAMVACDGPDCKREWFHLQCIGLSAPPQRKKWYCEDCKHKMRGNITYEIVEHHLGAMGGK